MAFSFGTAKPTFGATAATSSTPSFGFGTTTTTAPAFGFGTTTATSAPSFGGTGTSLFGGTGFGQAKTTASTGFGFGTTNTATTGGGLFGGTGFGQAKTTASTGFGFGTTNTATTGGGLFGGTGFGQAKPTGLFNTGTQAQAAPAVSNPQQELANLVTAVTAPVLFNDERDMVMAKWNQIQSFWGTGRAFSNQNCVMKPDTSNPFCRFKAVGYSKIPSTKDEDGLVGFIMTKSSADVKANQKQVVDEIYKAVQSKPQLSVCVESVVELPDNKTELVIYILERHPNGATKRLPASQLQTHFNSVKNQPPLAALNIATVVPKISFNAEQLKQYLENPPHGVDPLVWQQAKIDNPDPDNLIPIPMLGFSELNSRLQLQEFQSKMHKAALVKIGNDIAQLQRNHSNTMASIEQHKRKHLELGHRVLQVMAKQEIYRKLGYAIQGDEEQLRVHLEAIQAEMNAPTQFKGRLNELMSQIRMQNQLLSAQSEPNYIIDQQMQQEIRQHLKQQQDGLQHLISIIKDDMEDLQLIEQGMAQATRK